MIQGVVHAPSSFTLQPDLDYQLAFFTPGIKPLCANSRNFIRDIPNLRMYPRGRPSIKSRFFNRSGRASKGSLRKPSKSYSAFNSWRKAA